MASFLVRMFDLEPSGTNYFTDDASSIHQMDINSLAASGITTGCTDTQFCPKQRVTRAQMASFLTRAASLNTGGGRNYFNDDNSSIHELDIDRAAAAGIASGCGTWKYCPGGFVTREQMAAYLHRVVAPVPAPPYPAPPPLFTFGDGTRVVGSGGIPAGTYRRLAGDNCYWERLSGFGGTLGEIIANDFDFRMMVVEIKASDKGFSSDRCGTWTNNLSPVTSSKTSPFGQGTYIVGVDIAPGTWSAAGGGSCYWERLSGFGGQLADIIANDFGSTSPIVSIAPTDKGFKSSNCGNWTKIG